MNRLLAYILMKNHTLFFFSKIEKNIAKKMSSAAVVFIAFRGKRNKYKIYFFGNYHLLLLNIQNVSS